MIRVYFKEAGWELLGTFREYGYVIPLVLLPSFIFLLYGVLGQPHGHVNLHRVFHAFSAMVTFESMSIGLFTVGVFVAMDRQNGVLRLKRLYPTPPGTYMVAKILSAMALLFLSLFLLSILLLIANGLPSVAAWIETIFYAVIGVAPFAAIGLTIGLYAGARAAGGIANVVMLFLGFVSGVFISMHSLPGFMQEIIMIWPSHQLYELCYGAISGAAQERLLVHWAILSFETLIFAMIALYKWQRMVL